MTAGLGPRLVDRCGAVKSAEPTTRPGKAMGFGLANHSYIHKYDTVRIKALSLEEPLEAAPGTGLPRRRQ
eukprot:2110168-Karenia_brevis.AAC.1